jgi:hypothetical protein
MAPQKKRMKQKREKCNFNKEKTEKHFAVWVFCFYFASNFKK